MGKSEIESFLSYLATDRYVTASTLNQAFNALLFLYKNVLNIPLEADIRASRSRKSQRLPVVLSHGEVADIINHISGDSQLILQLMYGCGMRSIEVARLRIQDINFEQHQIIVREAKGNKDRATFLPKNLVTLLTERISQVKLLHQSDLKNDYGEVYLPFALSRKYPNAGKTFGW